MYKIVIPANVRKQMRGFKETDRAHLNPHLERLPEQLDHLRIDPRSGFQVRRDFAEAWFIEVGDYRLYYAIDDLSREIRCFYFNRYILGW